MTMLEDHLERVRQENAELKERLRGVAFREAGIDTDNGVGKALAKTYDGPPDPDAVREFAATEFGWGDDNSEEGTDDDE